MVQLNATSMLAVVWCLLNNIKLYARNIQTFYTFQDNIYLSAGHFIPFRTLYTFLQDILYLSGHFIPFRTFYTFLQDILYISGHFIHFRTFYTFQDILYLSAGHFIYLNPLLFDPWANFKQVTFY